MAKDDTTNVTLRGFSALLNREESLTHDELTVLTCLMISILRQWERNPSRDAYAVLASVLTKVAAQVEGNLLRLVADPSDEMEEQVHKWCHLQFALGATIMLAEQAAAKRWQDEQTEGTLMSLLRFDGDDAAVTDALNRISASLMERVGVALTKEAESERETDSERSVVGGESQAGSAGEAQ